MTSDAILFEKVIFPVLFASAVAIAIFTGGLTTYQLLVLIVLATLATLTIRGNRIFTRKMSLLHRDDVSRPPFGDTHIKVGWVFSPVLILSTFSFWASAACLLGLVLAYAKPIAQLITAKETGRLAAERAVERMKTERSDVIFYAAGAANSGYQINQWLPVAERMGLKSAVCLRSFDLLHEVDDTSVPVYFARLAEDIETIKDTCGAKIFLYPANPTENLTALRHSAMQHYFINHGESDKAVNSSKLLMAYDKLLVAGPLAKERLEAANLPLRKDHIAYVGRPQLEIFLDEPKERDSIKKVLYAPTWEGFVKEVDYSSVSDFGIAMLEQLLSDSDIEVVVKPHPFTGLRLSRSKAALKEIEALAEKYPNLTVLGHEHKIYPHMNWCDLMIADIGSVVNDFLATQKPMIVTSVQGLTLDQLHAEFPTTRGTYVVDAPADVTPLLTQIAEADPMAKTREDVRKQSLGDLPEGSLAAFEKAIRDGLDACTSPGSTLSAGDVK